MNLITELENFLIEFFNCDRQRANIIANLLIDRLEFLGLEITEKRS
jgi:hypothetical protein